MEGTFTADELEAAKTEALNKYKSDSEAGVQKVISEKKEAESKALFAEQVLDAVGEVAKDSTKLISIFDELPEVAERILERYYDGKTIEEYKESIGYEEKPEVMNEKLIEQKAKSIVNANKIKDTKKVFIEKLGLEGDELESFNNEFAERLELKSFNVDDLDIHLTKAYKLATGYSEEQIKEIQKSKAIASASSLSGGTKTKDADKSRIKSEIDNLLDGRI